MLALSFFLSKWFFFSDIKCLLTWIPLPFFNCWLKCWTQQPLNSHAHLCHFCQRMITRKAHEVYNYSLLSFHWTEHLPYRRWAVWKKTRDETGRKSVKRFIVSAKGRSSRKWGEERKKRSKWGQKKVNKVKDSSEQEKYLSRSQMFLFEMESRWFHQTDEPFGHTSSITLVKP